MPDSCLSTTAINLYFSYAVQDDAFLDKLTKHLKVMERQGIIKSWSDRQILPGTDRQNRIDQHLETAQIILLLISADFLTSNYCYEVEMSRALERHETGDACVIPILLSPVDTEGMPFGHLQSLPSHDRPVSLWGNEDEAWVDIAKGIRAVVESWAPHKNKDRGQRPGFEKGLINQIEKYLEKGWGLQEEQWIPLNAKEMPEQVTPSHKINFREPTQNSFCINDLESVIFSFKNLRVLILGEPGSGKSTTLMKFSKLILERAKEEINSPIPVIFDLSNYRDKKYPIKKWLENELSIQYKLERGKSKQLIEGGKITLMLDGLDELPPNFQDQIITNINNHLVANSFSSIIVCCRYEDYRRCEGMLQFDAAIYLEPLSNNQIINYFEKIEKLDSFDSISGNEHLLEVIKNPVFLRCLKIDDLNHELSASASLANVKFNLWKEYTEKSIKKHKFSSNLKLKNEAIFGNKQRKEKAIKRRENKIRHYISELSYLLKMNNETFFYLEHLQPDFLFPPIRSSARTIYILLSVILIILTGTALGAILAFIYNRDLGYELCPIISSHLSLKSHLVYSKITIISNWFCRDYHFASICKIGAIFGCLTSLLSLRNITNIDFIDYRLSFNLRANRNPKSSSLNSSPTPLLALPNTLDYNFLNRKIFIVIIISLILSYLTILSLNSSIYFALVALTVSFLLTSLFLILGNSVAFRINRHQDRSTYRQGLVNSFRNGVLATVLSSLFAFALWRIGILAVVYGIYGGLTFGLKACLQHFVLRFILWYQNRLPFNYFTFLDECSRISLMKRIGCRYKFTHNLLRDHLIERKMRCGFKDWTHH